MAPTKLLTTTQAAKMCCVHRRTMLRWVDDNIIPSHRTGGGRNRILLSDLLAFMTERGMPLPPEHAAPRIAIVDDDKRIVRYWTKLLRREVEEVEIRTANDGFTAGALIATFQPHLVLLDVVIEGVSGLEVCQWIRQQDDLQGTHVVVVSGHLDEELTKQLLKAGAAECFEKPIGAKTLRQIVATYVKPEIGRYMTT